jgi:hypothetical protein
LEGFDIAHNLNRGKAFRYPTLLFVRHRRTRHPSKAISAKVCHGCGLFRYAHKEARIQKPLEEKLIEERMLPAKATKSH